MGEKIIVCRAVIPILINGAVKICLGQNPPDKKYGPNLWTLPGGKQEPGEALHLTTVREIEGETTLVTTPHDLLFLVKTKRPDGTIIYNFIYLSQATGNSVLEGQQHDDQAQKVAFYTLDEIIRLGLRLTESTKKAVVILKKFDLKQWAELL
ncbi:MAG TPA: NUDIX domain-containing protein [bacterium]|nr:NUDIX domain-containing protein [bacterium]